MKKSEPKHLSRKFLLAGLAMVLSTMLPVFYKHDGIGDDITKIVLGIMSAIVIGYGGVNVLGKKFGQDD